MKTTMYIIVFGKGSKFATLVVPFIVIVPNLPTYTTYPTYYLPTYLPNVATFVI
jgi:hypothetical protein